MDEQFILNLADKLRWPMVVLLIALPVLFLCRKEIRDFIRRITSISPKSGITATPQPPQVLPPNPTGAGLAVADLSRQVATNVDPYVLSQRINLICAEFDSRGIGPGQREEALIELLAGALTRESWERIYLLIVGSQIRLLQNLNQSAAGITERDLRAIYESAAKEQPEYYGEFPFENWIAFVETTGMMIRNEAKFVITPYGRGFLKYLISQGRSFERFG